MIINETSVMKLSKICENPANFWRFWGSFVRKLLQKIKFLGFGSLNDNYT
jgi:hypothetical protein